MSVVYVVQRGEYEDVQIDSVWASAEQAEARKVVCEREYGQWRTSLSPFVLKWSPALLGDEHAECVADGAYVVAFELDVLEGRRESA